MIILHYTPDRAACQASDAGVRGKLKDKTNKKRKIQDYSFIIKNISFMGREQWIVRNTTKKHVNIGDLFKVPTISPGQNQDLLTYHTHGQITQSNDLATLLSMGWLSLAKSNVPSSVQLNRIEQDELDASIAEADPQTVTVTSSFVINDNVIDIVLADASNGDLAVTLPLASSNRQIYVKKIDSTANVVTVTGQNAQNIDDSLTWEISTQYVTIEIVADGSNWHIL